MGSKWPQISTEGLPHLGLHVVGAAVAHDARDDIYRDREDDRGVVLR